MNIGFSLKDARKQTGITQSEVERLSGIKAHTISNWETGIARPDVDSLVILCKLYNKSPNEIFGWEDTTGEINLLQLFRQLNDEGQETALDYLHTLAISGKYKKDIAPGMVAEEA